jgi:arylsulfatase A-like enzyme
VLGSIVLKRDLARPSRLLLPLAWGALFLACGPAAERAPQRLLEQPTTSGRLARVGRLSTQGVTRPVLMETGRYRVRLPGRPLLTFGLGMAKIEQESARGSFRLVVKADGQVMLRKSLDARNAHAFADVSLPLEGLGREATLTFQIRRDGQKGRPAAAGAALFGVSEPTIHDLDAYGRSRGVVLISIDTLRRDHVSAYGYPRPTTPRLESLARGGVLCEDAVSTSSWTLPAHLSMLTSTFPGQHGGVDAEHTFNHRVPTLAAVIGRAGYATRAVTSHLYVSSAYGLHEGFEQLDFRYDRKADEVAERAMRAIDQVGDRPFFLFLHFYDPHTHYSPPPQTRALFPSSYSGPPGAGILGRFQGMTRETIPAGYLDHLLALYDGEIRFVDDQVGRILDHLRERGLDRSTLVVVTADHGEEFLDHGGWGHEKTLYEEQVRIPLIVHGPGVRPRREAAQASLIDVLPTILDWADLPLPPQAQGRSLLRPLPRTYAYGETLHTKQDHHKLFLRGGNDQWKLVAWLDRKEHKLLREQWFDLGADPGERAEAAAAPSGAEALRRQALARWKETRSRAGAAPEVHLTPEQVESLRALGYLGT